MGGATSVRARYEAAVDELVADLQRDRQVVAVALFGSLAYDVVWDRSDIDLVIVLAERAAADPGQGMLCYGGVNVHAQLVTRDQFKRARSGALAGSASESMSETSRLLFSRDPTIDALFEQPRPLGERDRSVVLMRSAAALVPMLTKAQKWFHVKGDLEYASLWALFTLQYVARLEVVRRGLNPNREVIQQALELDPDTFAPLYFDLIGKKKTKALVRDRLAQLDRYLLDHSALLFGTLLEFLAERMEPVSAADIEHHFERQHSVRYAVSACEYLADNGIIEKTTVPVRLTRKSVVEVEGLAFMHIDGVPDGGFG